MVDLKELEREIDELLESKSDNDLLNWLEAYNSKNIESYIGEGQYFDMIHDPSDFEIDASSCAIYIPKDIGSESSSETKYGHYTDAA